MEKASIPHLETQRKEICQAFYAPELFVSILGPCSNQLGTELHAEGERITKNDIPNRLLHLHRRPFWKPRSNPLRDWNGSIISDPEATLEQVNQIQTQTSTRLAQEIGGPYARKLASIAAFGWIGARTVEDQELRDIILNQATLPVGIKNGMNGSLEPAQKAIHELFERSLTTLEEPIRPALVFRGGSEIDNPRKWETAVIKAAEWASDNPACAGLVIDLAHGSEIAHDPEQNGKKTVTGQIAAANHLVAMLAQERIPALSLKGIMIEASDIETKPERTTDPNMPLDRAVELSLGIYGERSRKLSDS